MKAIKTSIIIDAHKSKVWKTLMQFEKYSKWNPFIIGIEGEAKQGKYLKTQIQLGDKKVQKFKPEVLMASVNKEFRWKGKLFFKGLFDGEHYFILEELENNKTNFIHGEKFSGMFSKTILKMIKEDTIAGFDQMNQALKKLVESK